MLPALDTNRPLEHATFAGGCFWCLEAVFELLDGVRSVVSGYTGGQAAQPTYRDVCNGTTGHAEAVQVTFDPTRISFSDLLDVFFALHDPTTLNRQGNDIGTQYRSAIFYHTPMQQELASAKIAELSARQLFAAPIVTEIVPLQQFYAAENYHQGYYRGHREQPYCQFVIDPKVAKLRQKMAAKLKS